MNWSRLIALLASIGLGCLATPALAQGPASDLERLLEGLPPGFKRPRVLVLPLYDRRKLVDPSTSSADQKPDPPEAWLAFLDALAAHHNLEVLLPDAGDEAASSPQSSQAWLRARMKALKKDRDLLPITQDLANQGYEQYREVNLRLARRQLQRAVDTWMGLLYHLIEPRTVARALVTIGQTHLEEDQPFQAERAFSDALQIDPSLRLRPGFDRPEAVARMDAARQRLAQERRIEPLKAEEEALKPGGAFLPTDIIVIRGDLSDSALSVRVYQPFPQDFEVSIPLPGERQGPAITTPAEPGPDEASRPATEPGEDEGLEAEPDDPVRTALNRMSELSPAARAGEMLASRVWGCLPFGTSPRPRAFRRSVYIDAGLAWYTLLEAPGDGPFGHFGVSGQIAWQIAPQLTLDLTLQATNSNRDRSEDLREDIATLRGILGAGYLKTLGPFRLTAGFGFEVAAPGEGVYTTNPNCKFFDGVEVPTDLCDPERDIDREPGGVMIGAALQAGLAVQLWTRFYLAGRVGVSQYFYETRSNSLDRPLGLTLGMGYRL